MHRSQTRLAAALLLLVSASAAIGCAARCKDVRTNYKKALESPITTETSHGDADAPHMGVAISADRVDQLLDTVIRESIRGATSIVNNIDLGGRQPVKITTDPSIADLTISPAASTCDTCYKISAALDGTAGVSIPVLGNRRTSLSGSVDFTAPMILRTDGDGTRAKVMLDIPAAVSHGGFGVNAGLGQLPASWSSSLTSPLIDLLRTELADSLKPVKIAEFQAPSIKAAGLKFTATQLRPVGDGGAFFIGVRSNLQSAPTVSPEDMVTALASNSSGEYRDLAVALPVDLVAHAIANGFQTGKIPRSYDASGRTEQRSTTKVTMRRVQLATARSASQTSALDLSMGFQVWNIPREGACFSVEGDATTRVEIADGRLRVGVRDVEFGGGPATQLGLNVNGWRDAEFLKTGVTILSTSLSTESMRIGPTDIGVGGLGLRTSGQTIILGADLPIPTS